MDPYRKSIVTPGPPIGKLGLRYKIWSSQLSFWPPQFLKAQDVSKDSVRPSLLESKTRGTRRALPPTPTAQFAMVLSAPNSVSFASGDTRNAVPAVYPQPVHSSADPLKPLLFPASRSLAPSSALSNVALLFRTVDAHTRDFHNCTPSAGTCLALSLTKIGNPFILDHGLKQSPGLKKLLVRKCLSVRPYYQHRSTSTPQ